MIDNKSQILDELLVLRAQNGDQEAFGQLVVKWNHKLIHQSHIRTRNLEEAQDIVQEVWKWLTVNLYKLKDVSTFGSWIRTVVDRRSIDWVRKQRNKIEVIQTDGSYYDTINDDSSGLNNDREESHEQSINNLGNAIKKLNEESRLILTLYYSESNSIESISKILGLPKGTVKSRLFYAREKLKSMLKPKTK